MWPFLLLTLLAIAIIWWVVKQDRSHNRAEEIKERKWQANQQQQALTEASRRPVDSPTRQPATAKSQRAVPAQRGTPSQASTKISAPIKVTEHRVAGPQLPVARPNVIKQPQAPPAAGPNASTWINPSPVPPSAASGAKLPVAPLPIDRVAPVIQSPSPVRPAHPAVVPFPIDRVFPVIQPPSSVRPAHPAPMPLPIDRAVPIVKPPSPARPPHPAVVPFPIDRVFPVRRAPVADPLSCVHRLDYAVVDDHSGNEVCVHFLDYYYAKGKSVDDDAKEASNAILSLKHCGSWGVQYWRDRVGQLLTDLGARVLVVPVPGHEVGDSKSAERIRRVVAGIAQVDFENCLIREETVPKSSGARAGGYSRATMERHHETISCRVPKGGFRGRPVLLVDDVVTLGSSTVACLKRLREAGASSVTCFCLTKTDNRVRVRSGFTSNNCDSPQTHVEEAADSSFELVRSAPAQPLPIAIVQRPKFSLKATKAPDPVTTHYAPHSQATPAKTIGMTPYAGIQKRPHLLIESGGRPGVPVHYFARYIPRGHATSKSTRSSDDIRSFRAGDTAAIDLFARAMFKVIKDRSCDPVFVVIPSGCVGAASPDSPLRRMLGLLNLGTDLSACIARKSRDLLQKVGDSVVVPLADDHLQSLELVHSERLGQRDVVLLDYVVASGETMLAARSLLMMSETKPRSVTCLVLGRVVSPDFTD
jgi:predicted amidophosphoribosyltransferase